MPFVRFLPSGKSIEVEYGSLLFDAAIKVGLPVASSCTAEQVCGRCNMQVVDGRENLSGQQKSEVDLLLRDKKPERDRISCMTQVLGDCAVTTTYW